jgi:hypothetical protein
LVGPNRSRFDVRSEPGSRCLPGRVTASTAKSVRCRGFRTSQQPHVKSNPVGASQHKRTHVVQQEVLDIHATSFAVVIRGV